MKGVVILLSVAAVLIPAGILRADVPVATWSQDVGAIQFVDRQDNRPTQCLAQVSALNTNPTKSRRSAGLGLGCIFPRRPLASSPAPEPNANIAVLPPGPSSISLFFAAFGSLGAWQVVRLAGNAKLHLGPLPQWYHTGGPSQVGHASALDLLNQMLVFCRFDRTDGNDPPLACLLRRDTSMRRMPQFTLAPAVPRGPPMRCS
jgi:hypothetical protein